jgi:hypothetical protein
MAKSDKSKGNKADKKGKKGKGKKGAAGGGVSVAAHPRAAAQVRRAKGLGGLIFFVLVAYLSHQANVPPDQIALRALAGGIGGYMLAWACSVSIWRHLVLAEIRAAIEQGQATLEPPAPGEAPPAPSEG